MLWALAGLLLLAAAASNRSNVDEKPQPKSTPKRDAMIALVRAEANRQGVPPPIALAMAEAESNFNPEAAGDLHWADKRPALYQTLVLEGLPQNPMRLDRSAWHSYGLFQLLAPHHVRATENPAVLYDPQVNAQRGVAYLKGLMRKHGDDVAQVRLAFAGALGAKPDVQEKVLTRFAQIYQRWHDLDAKGLS